MGKAKDWGAPASESPLGCEHSIRVGRAGPHCDHGPVQRD